MSTANESQDELIDPTYEVAEEKQFYENEAHNAWRDMWFRENPEGDMYAGCEYESEGEA